jgi:hypothetical protein
LLIDPETIKKYYALYQAQILGLFPMLELKVKVYDIRSFFGTTSLPLFRALAQAWILKEYTGAQPPLKVGSLIDSWIDDALLQVKKQTLINIQTVGNAEKLEDLENVATGSVLSALALEHFPEFSRFQKEFFESKLLPTEVDHFMHHYVGGSILYTCTPIFMILLSKWVSGGSRWILRHGAQRLLPLKMLLGSQALLRFFQSRSQILLERTLPRSAYYRGLMKAVLVPIVADTGYQSLFQASAGERLLLLFSNSPGFFF